MGADRVPWNFHEKALVARNHNYNMICDDKGRFFKMHLDYKS